MAAVKRILTIAIVAVALSGCAAAPQSTPIAALPTAVAKCGPPPVRASGIGRPGSVLGALTGGSETETHFQQRQAIYALCERGDPSYPAVLTVFIQAEGRVSAARARADESNAAANANWLAQQDANFWSMVNAQQQQQANFWNMVGAMNSLPR